MVEGFQTARSEEVAAKAKLPIGEELETTLTATSGSKQQLRSQHWAAERLAGH